MSNTIYRVVLEKLGGVNIDNFIGTKGDLFYDPEVPTVFKLSDGNTLGGLPFGNTLTSDPITVNGVAPDENGNIVIDLSGTTISWTNISGVPVALTAAQAAATPSIRAIGTTATTAAAGNHTHSNVTTTVAGFMSNTDKVKLDGIASNANNYTLPAATVAAIGGVKQATAVADAVDDTDIVQQFNSLLASLRVAGSLGA